MKHLLTDDRHKVRTGDYVRVCNCIYDKDNLSCNHPQGLFVRREWDKFSRNGDIFDAWIILINGKEEWYPLTYPIRIVNEGG